MNMKQTLIALLLVLTLGTTDVVVAQRHRHTPRTEALSGKATPDDKAHQTAAGKAKDEGIDAFSDTTSAADATVMDTTDTTYTSSYDDDVDDFNDASWFIKAITGTLGASAVLFALLIIVLIFLLLISPFIVVVLVLRYLFKRHNDKVLLAEKAMESGQAIPSEAKPRTSRSYTREGQWQRGIRNVSIGLGLMGLFWFIDAEGLIGVGVLVLCMGAGQMFIARTSRGMTPPNADDMTDEDQTYDEKPAANEQQETEGDTQ